MFVLTVTLLNLILAMLFVSSKEQMYMLIILFGYTEEEVKYEYVCHFREDQSLFGYYKDFFFLLLQLLNELSKLFAELFKKNIDKICTFYAQSYIWNLNHTFYS